MSGRTILLALILLIFLPSSFIHPADMTPSLNQNDIATQPLGFYQVSSGNDLPPVTPLGVKEDQFGNIHTWYYIQSEELFSLGERLTVYYNIAYNNGTNLLRTISVEETPRTKFSILHKQQLVETQNGDIYTVFVRSTDFGVNIIHMKHHPDTGINFKVIPHGEGEITGAIIGPVKTTNSTEYFVPLNNGTTPQVMQISFVEGALISTKIHDFPTIDISGNNVVMQEIFDITIANDSIFYLGSIPLTSGYHQLELIKQNENGSFSSYANRSDLNVAPILADLDFISSIRQDIIKPQLISTTAGRLYSYLFSISEEIDLNELVIWSNSSTTNVFQDAEEDPFLISFLPTIAAVENTIKIASLGVQIAQDIFTIAIDYFNYNTITEELLRDKIQDASFSTGFFFFAMDYTSSTNLGMVGTISIPSYLKDQYQILNNTVGATILFSNADLPDIEPYFNEVVVADNQVESSIETDNTTMIIVAISLVILALSVFLYWRIATLDKIRIDGLDLDESHRQKGILSKITNLLAILSIHLKSNWRRYFVTTIALIIPILLILSLFTGLLSHQDYLIQTYESQNPLNDAVNSNLPDADFTWRRSLYDDEFANNTINPTQWALAEQLTNTVLGRSGVSSTVTSISSTTVFPLFEKRLGSFVDNNENQTINYPFGHNVAIIDPTWYEYFQANLIEGRLPLAPGEVVIHDNWLVEADLLSPSYEFGQIYGVGSELELYASELDIFLNSTVSGLSQNITIVGVIEKAENQPIATLSEWAKKLGTTIRGLRFLDEIPLYMDPFFGTELLNQFSRLSLRPTSYVNLRYDVFSLERDEIPEIIKGYEGMVDRTFQETGIPWLGEYVDDRVITFLERYFTASNNIQLEATVIVIPVLGLILLLNYEALGIGRSSQEEEIVRYKRQGMRSEKLLLLFTFERFLTTGVATLVATILTPLTTPSLLSLTGFFQVNARSTPPLSTQYLIAMSIALFLVLWIVGILLSQKYSLSIEDWRYQNYVSGIKGDLIIILVSSLLIGLSVFVSNTFEGQLNLSSPEEALNSNIELIFLTFRMISLLLGTFGVVVIFSKVLNLTFTFFGKFIWRIKRTKFTLSFNGISSSMGLYGKLLVVIAISLFLIVPMVIVPQTLQSQYTVDAYGNLGTDIIGSDWHNLDESTQNQIISLPDVATHTEYFYGVLEFGNNLLIKTLAIDPSTFPDATVLPESYFERFDINPQDYQNLGQNEIITNEEFIDRNPIRVGDQIELGFAHIDSKIELRITESFLQFPILKYELEGSGQSDTIPLQMVITLDTLSNLQDFYNTNSTVQSSTLVEELNERKIAIKVDDTTKIDTIADEIRDIAGTRLTLLSDYVLDQQHPFFRIFEFISHLSIIVGILAPVLSMLIFSNILFERRKFELEVYRRNGLPNSFFIRQLSFEVFLAVLLPSFAGIYLGLLWTAYYGIQLFGQTLEEVVWSFNPAIIWAYTGMVQASSLVIWIVRIYSQTTQYIKEVRL